MRTCGAQRAGRGPGSTGARSDTHREELTLGPLSAPCSLVAPRQPQSWVRHQGLQRRQIPTRVGPGYGDPLTYQGQRTSPRQLLAPRLHQAQLQAPFLWLGQGRAPCTPRGLFSPTALRDTAALEEGAGLGHIP